MLRGLVVIILYMMSHDLPVILHVAKEALVP